MMDRLLQHPGWLKAISLLLAFVLWVTVVPRYAQDQALYFDVPLQVVNHPEFLVVEGPENGSRTVRVEVKGRNFVVNRVKADNLWARVDYSQITEPGRQHLLRVAVGGEFAGPTYSVTPESIPVTLVARGEGAFPVQVNPATRTVVHEGKEYLFTARAEVDEVTLSGRADYLSLVRVARVELDALDLIPTNTQVRKQVIPTDASGKSVDKLSPVAVNVQLSWAPLPPGKSFKIQATTRGSLPAGLAVTGTEVDPPTITVRAATLGGALPEREVVETEPVDLTGKIRSFTSTVRLVAPPGTTVPLETVNVKVNIAEIPQEKVLKGIPLEVRGQAANAAVVANITDVQVRVSGSYTMVTNLQARDISAYIDVEGLGSGTHTLPVKVAAPPGITAAVADPATVKVEVTVATP